MIGGRMVDRLSRDSSSGIAGAQAGVAACKKMRTRCGGESYCLPVAAEWVAAAASQHLYKDVKHTPQCRELRPNVAEQSMSLHINKSPESARQWYVQAAATTQAVTDCADELPFTQSSLNSSTPTASLEAFFPVC
jgi:hypothetical protein